MLMRCLSLVLLGVLTAARTAGAVEPVNVLVLPFTIHASQDLSYLREDIPKAIQESLQAEGALIVPLDPSAAADLAGSAADLAAYRRMGLEAGADSLIWGSMTRIGESISLDVSLLETVGSDPVVSIYESGTGMENMRAIVKKASEKLARQLFRQEMITRISIAGNKRIESDAIERVIRIQAGDVLRGGDISRDMRSIYKMGYFDDIRVEAEEDEGGKAIVFHVQEKPTIRRISFSGNEVFKDDKLREN
ncbi:MAG TPA: POTRA domain-containing protein, partial [Desulfosarcina sp.]|nr:POTRA domain-containing protein [Desulfosarcina sp.]